ncbi:MAG TPA: hypothetical protein EYP81_03560 [Thermodesulfobacteriaceae bacterium]|nr:hypothetical protein [Thermodesulfobacteriaceae bacterium]
MVPITLALVFFLLFSSFNSVRLAVLIMANLPLALVGGIVALWLTGRGGRKALPSLFRFGRQT